MARSTFDLTALIQRLVGDAAAVMLFDNAGSIVARFGSDDLLGRKAAIESSAEQGSQFDLIQFLIPADRTTFLRSYGQVRRGDLATAEMRARTQHVNGHTVVFDIRLESLSEGGDRLILVRLVDVTELHNRETCEQRRLASLTLLREVSQRLTLCAVSCLSAEVGNSLELVAGPTEADCATLVLVDPNGRGCRWDWSSGSPVVSIEFEGHKPFNYRAMNGYDTVVSEPTVVRSENQLTATASETWGNGMRSELRLDWNGRTPSDLDSTIQELPGLIHVFQGGLARLTSEAVASAERLRAEMIFRQLSDLVVVWSPDGTISFATPSFLKLVGVEDSEKPLQLGQFVVDHDTALANFCALSDGHTSSVTRLTISCARANTVELRTIEVVTINLVSDLYVGGFVTTGRDVTDSIAAAELQARKDGLAQVVASISSRFVNGPTGTTHAGIRKALGDVAEYCDVERALVWQKQRNGSLFVTHEYTAGDITPLGNSLPMIPEALIEELLSDALDGRVELCLHNGQGGSFVSAVEATGDSRLGAILVVGLRNADGVIGLLTFSASRLPDGMIPALRTLESADTQAALRTVGELVTNVLTHSAAQDALTYNATHDSLTGLANRRLLLDRADRMLRSARRRGNGIGLLFLDIDDFKVINDTLGHDFGDELLRDAGNRLRRIAVGSTVVARLGGDEFILLIEAKHPREAVRLLARQIATELERPFELGDREVALKISVGAVTVDLDETELPSPGDLVRRADMAMYAAKHRGGNSFELFSDEMEEQAQRRFNLHDELRVALIANQLELWYQPQVCLQSGKFVGCEALVRWRHPTKGFILPNEFIGAAEQAGLIQDLGIWVFTRAAETLAELRFEGLIDDTFEIAVNVSPLQLINASLVNDFTEVATRFNVPTHQLKIELTESTLAERDRVIPNLIALRAAGFHTSIDDFGTGYSSLSYLRDLPLNELKIDRSFVMSIEEQKRDLDMVAALVGMAHSLELTVVAEGVETEGQRDRLKAMGCNVGQGWLFSKPVPLVELSLLLDNVHVATV
jgi:diguanylate cyclase (GGDEF)-like protein